MDIEQTSAQLTSRMESAIFTTVAVDSTTHAIQNLRIDDEDQNERALNAMRQVEFYFSDCNLPYDRFMWTRYSANAEHWVPIATIASFKRMSEYQPLGPQWLVDTLRESIHLEVDGEGTHIRRRTEVQQNSDWDRSVYAKGFGVEVDGLQRDLERFFERYGRTNAIHMRQDRKTKAFKGSVFAEFADPLSVQSFLNADPKPSWNGQELLIMTKKAYCQMKITEKGLTGKKSSLYRGHIGGPGFRGLSGFNAFKKMMVPNKPQRASWISGIQENNDSMDIDQRMKKMKPAAKGRKFNAAHNNIGKKRGTGAAADIEMSIEQPKPAQQSTAQSDISSAKAKLLIERIKRTLEIGEKLVIPADSYVRFRKPNVDLTRRSVYVQGFGEEAANMQQLMEQFFGQHGKTTHVVLEKPLPEKNFTGAVYVEYTGKKSRDAFLQASPMWNGKELLIVSGDEFADMVMRAEILQRRAAAIERRNHEIAQKKLERSHNSSETQEQTGTAKGKDVKKEERKTQGDKQNPAGQDSDKSQSMPQLQFKFMGKETTIHEGEQGFFLQEEEMPYVSGASMKFECDQGDIRLSDIQKIMRMLYTSGHRPFVKYTNGESAGLIGFKKPLSREDVVCIPAYLKTRSGQYLTWSSPDEETERTFQMECAQLHALRVLRTLLRYRGKRDSLQIKGIAGNATDKMDTDSDVVSQDPVLAVPAPFSASTDGRAEKRKRDLEDDDTDEDDIYDANLLTEARLVVRIAKRARV